jgi:ABC-2 type transport system permease protein
MKRLAAMAAKELRHILRDPRSLAVAVLMPLMLIVLFGYAIDMELRNLPLGIMDLDKSPASRALIRDITSSGFIRDTVRLDSRSEVEAGFRRNRFQAALVIPTDYAENLTAQPQADVQLLIDGADAATASTVDNYLQAVLALVNQRLRGEAGQHMAQPLEVRPRFLFNPELISAHFIVPGLVAVVLIMICAMLTSIAITREKETGTLEQILTTPVRPNQIIVGKLLPYLMVGAFAAALVLAAGRWLFHVPMLGSWPALAAYSLLYILIALSMGLLISTLVQSQRLAMMMAIWTTLLPTLLLSGFIFDIPSMPLPLRLLSQAIPATYFIRVIRGIMLVGVNWHPLEGSVMLAMTLALLALATRRFKARLE